MNAQRNAQLRYDDQLPADADRDELAAESINERLGKLDPDTCFNYASFAACQAERDEDNNRFLAQTEIGMGIVSMHSADWLELLGTITDRSPILGAALEKLAATIVADLRPFIADEIESLSQMGEMHE